MCCRKCALRLSYGELSVREKQHLLVHWQNTTKSLYCPEYVRLYLDERVRISGKQDYTVYREEANSILLGQRSIEKAFEQQSKTYLFYDTNVTFYLLVH